MKIRVIFILGTRSEIIKLYPLIKRLEKNVKFDVFTCVTQVCEEAIDSIFQLFKITPKYKLNIKLDGKSIIDMSNEILKCVDNIITDISPDIVFVNGTTSTTLNSALAAFYQKVPVGYIELDREGSYGCLNFSEEINRLLVSEIASIKYNPINISNKINRNETICLENSDSICNSGGDDLEEFESFILRYFDNKINTCLA